MTHEEPGAFDVSEEATDRRGFIRRHKAAVFLLALAGVLLAGVLALALLMAGTLEKIPRFDADLERPTRPSELGTGTTFLLAGVDDGKGTDLEDMLAAETWTQGIFRSDTIMVAHLTEDGDRAHVVSIPRDSWVEIEGHGRSKVNAAFSYGGPALLARTVEDLTGLRIDHVLVADARGFISLTDAIGGVRVQVRETVPRSQGGGNWTAGEHTVAGEDAYAYVRQRSGLPRGDFDRVSRQQNLLRAIAMKSTQWNLLLNPFTLSDMLDAVSENLAVDSSLTDRRMRQLALSMRNLEAGDITFLTAPHDGTGREDGQSVVRLRIAELRELCAAMVRDELDAFLEEHDVERLPSQGQVP